MGRACLVRWCIRRPASKPPIYRTVASGAAGAGPGGEWALRISGRARGPELAHLKTDVPDWLEPPTRAGLVLYMADEEKSNGAKWQFGAGGAVIRGASPNALWEPDGCPLQRLQGRCAVMAERGRQRGASAARAPHAPRAARLESAETSTPSLWVRLLEGDWGVEAVPAGAAQDGRGRCVYAPRAPPRSHSIP